MAREQVKRSEKLSSKSRRAPQAKSPIEDQSTAVFSRPSSGYRVSVERSEIFPKNARDLSEYCGRMYSSLEAEVRLNVVDCPESGAGCSRERKSIQRNDDYSNGARICPTKREFTKRSETLAPKAIRSKDFPSCRRRVAEPSEPYCGK